MKQRIISAGIGLIVFLVVLFFFETPVLNLAISILSALCAYELIKAKRLTRFPAASRICLGYAVAVPLARSIRSVDLLPMLSYVFVLALLGLLIRDHQRFSFEDALTMGAFSIMVPMSFSVAIFFRDIYGIYAAFYYILLVFAGAWLTDTGAYFFGRAFGKRKLAPVISPNKTVEGLIGGIFTGVTGYVLITLAFSAFLSYNQIPFSVNYFSLIITGLMVTGAAVVGDLSASIVKRQCGIKDFGYIMPGHGGMMDRFDSVLLVAPLLFCLTRWFPVLTIL